MDEAAKVGEELVVAGGDAAELLEAVKEALDAVALLVQDGVVAMRLAPVPPRWDDEFSPGIEDGIVQVVGVVAPVGDDRAGCEALDQGVGLDHVALLAGAEQQADGVAQGIGGGVDLGGQAAFGAAQALGMCPPFSRRAPAAC